MTEIEAEATGGLGSGTDSGSGWTQFLIPIVAAALVLAFGLAIVSLTTEAEPPYETSPTSEAGVF